MKGSKISNIELLQALKSLKLLKKRIDIPDAPYNTIVKAILDKIGQSIGTIENRLDGLRAEDEFLLLCIILGSVESIVPLIQKKYLNKNYVIPDFLVSVLNKDAIEKSDNEYDNLYIETKKMKENEQEFIISLRYMEKLYSYVSMYKIPLYFAIKTNLTKYGFKQWLLVPYSLIKNEAKIELKKTHGRIEEKSYVIDVLKLIEKDHMGLWFHNYSILIPQGFKIVKEYSKIQNSPIKNNEYGCLIKLSVEYKSNKKEIIFENGPIDNRNLVFYELCGFLWDETVEVEYDDDKSYEIFEAFTNYYQPFYNVILKTYLEIRKDFYKAIDDLDVDDISFYLENFSTLDENIVLSARDILFEFNKLKLVMLIRMMPNIE